MSSRFSIQSVQHRHGSTDEPDFVVHSTYVQPAHPTGSTWTLGPADLAFAVIGRPPTIVQLALFIGAPIHPSRFATALCHALAQFECAAGQSAGASIVPGYGVRFSAIRLTEKQLLARPPPASLFDLPGAPNAPEQRTDVFTLRLANGSHSAGIGCCFDHSLCDVAGAAMLLAHVSASYADQAPPPLPIHARELQVHMALADPAPSTVQQISREPQRLAVSHKKRGGLPGGVVYLEWSYSATLLQVLKTK